MSRLKNISIWLIWLSIFPTSMTYLYFAIEPNFTGYWVDIIAFAIIMCAVAYFPIQVGSITIFFINGVSFAVFLYFGLFAEIVLTQLALISLLIKIKLKKSEFYRIATNSTMLFLTSIFAAVVYYALGGTHGVLSLNTLDQIIPLVGYIVGSIVVNQVLLALIDIYVKGNKFTGIPSSLLVDSLVTAMIFPIGLILYILYLEIGLSAIFIVGFPAILLSVVISTYHKGQQINKYLHDTSNIGHELSKKLNVKDVLDTFVEKVHALIPMSYIYVYDITNSSRSMNMIRYVSDDETQHLQDISLEYGEGFAGQIYKEEIPKMLVKRSQLGKIENSEIPEEVNSAIGVPIMRKNLVVGVLVIASKRKYAYEKYHLMLLEILGNFLSVAIENARHYQSEKNKSQCDRLTGLYNYRYFTEHLESYAFDLQEKELDEELSIILFDLDSFKELNDTYGHEAGNEVLIELARRIEAFVGEQGLVARYGGEEFTVLIKGYKHHEAVDWAELLRAKIAQEPFKVTNHMLDHQDPIKIYVTASIGVATYPDHCETPDELIRQADRSMYVGAKRNGKNRVASAEEAI
ncbi:diguanylate cyclase (GGDEF)-like protein [Alkalibacillus flavidus]|uniref:Diguanylate cyclase (GGDEF)-like protein n=1 Tax=Alkalibacillus flavidus TaxID=546021 RepID=A0ABV2KSI8_9BACI